MQGKLLLSHSLERRKTDLVRQIAEEKRRLVVSEPSASSGPSVAYLLKPRRSASLLSQREAGLRVTNLASRRLRGLDTGLCHEPVQAEPLGQSLSLTLGGDLGGLGGL